MENRKEKYFIADIVVKAVLANKGKVLLTLDHNGAWELPGGRMNEGEQPEETLEREIKEELNINVKPIAPSYAFQFTSDSGKNHFVIVYVCEAGSLDNLKINDGEVKDLKWVGKEGFKNLKMRSGYKNALVNYF